MSRWLRRRRRRVLAILPPLLAAACISGGISRDELSTQPIALVYWEPEDARRRAELMDPTRDSAPTREGIARMQGLGRLLGASNSRQWQALERYPGHLSLLDPQTREITRVAAAPAGSRPMAWSSDHRKLLFVSSHRDGTPQLYEHDVDSGELRAVTYGDVAHVYGDYAADGRIGFAALPRRERGLRVDLHVTERAGGSARMVLSGELAESMRLSPDGKVMVYVRFREPDSAGRSRGPLEELVLLSLEPAEGEVAEPRRVGPGRYPTFSPDGQWIVYSAPSKGRWWLRRVRVDGSARSPVGHGGIRDEKWPAVSPDGRYVAYVGESGGLDRLFVRRFDGSGDRILLDRGAVALPVW